MNYKKKKNFLRVVMIIVAILMFVGIAMSGLVTAFAAEDVTVETFESGSLYNAFNEAKEDTDQNNVKSFTVKSGVVSSADFSMFGNLSSCEIIDLSGTEFEGGKIPDNFMSGRRVSEFYAPKNITTIGNNAFSGCGNLKKLSFTNSLEMVGNRAFESCSSLTSVYFPESLKLVDECAFRGSGLTDIYFYGNAPEVKSEVFPTSATIHITENATG
ncbi:MAG: leucine-rich repeat domain-containing protein, partial [Oscillospiraceae bacterium]|nr:leucine-rich repeat domain-containing protein [Oscillospiraceae bacterium]